MDPKIIFSIILAVALIYFKYGAGSRLLKKKSHHYIVPPACEKDPNWLPIEFQDYKKQIFIQQIFDENGLVELKRIITENAPTTNYEIESRDNWFIIEINDSRFDNFHQLISAYYTLTGGEVIGYCSNANSPKKDYIVKVDGDAGFDFLQGTFRNRLNFAIYLPKSSINSKGNISTSQNSELNFNLEFAKLPSSGS